MWRNLKDNHSRLYEAIEWGILALSAGSFVLALAVYLRGGGQL